MLYNDPTTRERADYTDTETALTPEKTSRTMGEVATKTLALEAILNSLPDRSGNSSSDTSSDK
mgnify:CR=1 FL=1